MTVGCTYELRHTARVCPNLRATLSMASTTFLFASVSDSKPDASRSALGGQYSACPRAEILGGEFLAADFSQVAVDLVRGDHPALAVAIEVLKKVLARQVLATFDHPRDSPVSHPDGDLDAALALEKKADSGAPDVDVSVAQRGQPERVVLPGVFLVADPEVRRLEQADDGRHDLILRQPVTSQITRDAPPEAGQDLSEAGHAVEFVGVTGLAPARVIAMLLATPGVPPACLQMAARAGRDPDVIPRGRNRKRPNPVQGGEVPDALAVGSDVLKLLALAHAPDAWFLVGGVDKAGFLRGLESRVRRGESYAAAGGVTPGPPHPGCIAVSRLRFLAQSLTTSSSRGVSSWHGRPICQRAARTSTGNTSSQR